MASDDQVEKAKETAVYKLRSYGESSVPPTVLATLIAAQHLRPLRVFPLAFAPAFLFSSYLNVNGFKKDAAGFSAAISGLYLVLAGRRYQPLSQRFSIRGLVRGATLGFCAVQIAGGGLAYVFSKREEEES